MNNTIFKELLQEDDTTLQITNEVLKEIEGDLEIKFNDDEKCLLVYHFKASLDRNMYIDRKKVLLVCGLGYGTSKLLEKQLKENFNIDVVDIIAFHELDEAIKIYKNLDLIVSTLDIEKNIKIPYIKLDTFLNENECQKIINKGEAINSVGRLIFFGKHGRLNESTIEKQLEKASCLNILLSSLIIWNSRYFDKVYWAVKDKDWFDEKEFKRVSPLGTQHVNFLGKYIFEEKIITAEDGLRELVIKDLDE